MPFLKWVLFDGVFIHESFVKRLLFYVSSCLFTEGMQRSKFYSDKTFFWKLLVGMIKIACMSRAHTLKKKEIKGC